MGKYPNAVSGLKQVFYGKLQQMICAVLPMTMLVTGLLLGGGALFVCAMYVYCFGRILFPIMCVVGLYRAGKDIGACKKAAVLCLVDVAVLGLRFIVQADGIGDHTYIVASAMSGMLDWRLYGVWMWIDKIAAIVHCVVLFLMVYFVSTSIAKVLEELGANKIAKAGPRVWEMQLVAGIIYLLVSFWPYSILNSWSGIADFVASIFYLRFLYRSYRALGIQDTVPAGFTDF